MSEPVLVDVLTFGCVEAVEIPPQCPACGQSLARFEVLAPATGRLTLDAETFDSVDGEQPEYDGPDFFHLARCPHCRTGLTHGAEIHGAGAVTSWHVRCLASYLHGEEDPRALGRLRSDLELGPHVDGAWDLACLENGLRAAK